MTMRMRMTWRKEQLLREYTKAMGVKEQMAVRSNTCKRLLRVVLLSASFALTALSVLTLYGIVENVTAASTFSVSRSGPRTVSSSYLRPKLTMSLTLGLPLSRPAFPGAVPSAVASTAREPSPPGISVSVAKQLTQSLILGFLPTLVERCVAGSSNLCVAIHAFFSAILVPVLPAQRMLVIPATVVSSPPRQDDAQLRPGHVVILVDAF